MSSFSLCCDSFIDGLCTKRGGLICLYPLSKDKKTCAFNSRGVFIKTVKAKDKDEVYDSSILQVSEEKGIVHHYSPSIAPTKNESFSIPEKQIPIRSESPTISVREQYVRYKIIFQRYRRLGELGEKLIIYCRALDLTTEKGVLSMNRVETLYSNAGSSDEDVSNKAISELRRIL